VQENKRIWIVGGSTGIGLELVQLCLESNYYVIASSRNATKNDSLLMLKDEYQEKIKLIDIDEFFTLENFIKFFKLLPVPDIKTAVLIFLGPINFFI